MDLYAVGDRIKSCRQLSKLTREQFAEKIDLSAHYVYEIERGSKMMTLGVLEKISVELNVSTDYILFGYEREDADENIPEKADQFYLITHDISPKRKEALAHIIEAILPCMK